MPDLSLEEENAVATMRGLAEKKAVVVIGKDISNEVELFAEPGMKARLIHFGWSGKYGCWMAKLDFSEFEAFNEKFETAGFHGANGTLKTYRELFGYKPQDDYYIPLEGWERRFQAVDPLSNALLSAFQEAASDGETYTGWLERHAAVALGLEVAQASIDIVDAELPGLPVHIGTHEVDELFPDRLQGHGFANRRAAVKDAREKLGGKAQENMMFVLLADGNEWTWLGASALEYKGALLGRQEAARKPRM